MEEPMMVSVAIPFYNQEGYIQQTLQSVLEQKTNFKYEIVVGDDCSTDNSKLVFSEFEKRYPQKVRVMYNPVNLGLVSNVKNILDKCNGKYIALLGGDDFFSSELKLQKQVDFMEQNPEYGLVHSDAKLLLENGEKASLVESADKYYNRQVKVGNVFNEFLMTNFIIPSTALFKKDLYDKYVDLAFYKSIGFQAEDRPMFLEFASRSKFGYIKESLATYRVRTGTLSRPNKKESYYLFCESSFKGRLYFVNKYCKDKIVIETFMTRFNTFNLVYAFEFSQPERAEEAANFFNGKDKMDKVRYLYYWGAKSKIVWFLVKILRKFNKGLWLSKAWM